MDIECPYCEKEFDLNHDDGFGYSQDVTHQTECPHCGKNFVFTTCIYFTYSPEKADCLNGEKHDYKLTHTFPKEFSQMECQMCGDRRDLTEQEKTEHGIRL
jgi:DNA-directed RNA polymerase subunit RPC12/RpoP